MHILQKGFWLATAALDTTTSVEDMDIPGFRLHPLKGKDKGDSGISPGMSLRLSKVLGRTPESWLAMQDKYDLWVARNTVNLDDIHPLDFAAA